MTRKVAYGLFAILAGCGGVLADGMMMPRLVEVGTSTKMVSSHRQEAVLVTDGQTVQVTLRTHFRAGPAELAWFVPVPAEPTRIEPAEDELFQRLAEATTPRFFRLTSSPKGVFGCGCGGLAVSPRSLGADPAVVVEAVGTAGIFEYTVLSATRSTELIDWLNQHRYAVPVGTERLFDAYVRRGWHWLAMRLRAEAQNKGDLAPHPIRYAYEDSKLVYPLAISQLSADLESEVVVYVVGNCRFALGNWANAEVTDFDVSSDPRAASGTNYECLVRSRTDACQGRLFVTEFARYLDHGVDPWLVRHIQSGSPLEFLDSVPYITRLRAVVTREAMDRDASLIPSVTWPDVENETYLSQAPSASAARASVAMPLAVILLMWIGARLRRRGPRWRTFGSICIVLSALACASL